MNNDIRRAVAIFRESPASKDQDIYKLLVADGVERRSAALLVVFLPMVYYGSASTCDRVMVCAGFTVLRTPLWALTVDSGWARC
jgi:hypothetical protein